MIALLPCPHCGSEPWFEGDAGQWQDDNRYVEMSVKCCATLTEWIGWQKARDMTKAQREAELKTRLTAAWNKREVPEDAPKAAPARAEPTDEQIDALIVQTWGHADIAPQSVRAFARAVLALRGAPARQPIPAFDDIDDETIDAACTAGSVYRVDLMRAYEVLRAHGIGSKP